MESGDIGVCVVIVRGTGAFVHSGHIGAQCVDYHADHGHGAGGRIGDHACVHAGETRVSTDRQNCLSF